MNERLLDYYNRELQFMREMGGEFAREFPKVAGRLGLDGFECADPYVERMLEGFAFLAARVQLKIDAEFPQFTQALLEMVYPHYLAPTPSMAVVQIQPDLSEGSLAAGVVVPRGTAMQSLPGEGEDTACDYRTAHEVTLWPLEILDAEYYGYSHDVSALGVSGVSGANAALRIRLRCTAGLTFAELALDRLSLYLRGPDEMPMRLYEQFLANVLATKVRTNREGESWRETSIEIRALGFSDEEALFPRGARSFDGYRLLREYFAFPQRFMSVELAGLDSAIRGETADQIDVLLLLSQSDPVLEQSVDKSHFGLFCTPAINLFPKRTDRIRLDPANEPFHIVADRTRPLDFEVYEVQSVTGHGSGAQDEQEFSAFYTSADRARMNGDGAYYAVQREPRLSAAERSGNEPRTSYSGGELFISLVDSKQAPYSSDLRQLALTTLCTNRDLPLLMPIGRGKTDFTIESGLPIEAVRCVAGPTAPKVSHAGGETAWRLISHLSLNYLSLLDTDEHQGAAAFRELLSLYGESSDPSIKKQIEGVRSITARPVTRRLPVPGPIAFGRGLEITVTFDESEFIGSGAFLLGAVLERFFARYASINTFTETVIQSLERGELIRWTPRTGTRQTL